MSDDHVHVSVSNPPITIPPLDNATNLPNLKVKATARIALPAALVPPRLNPKAVEKAVKVVVRPGDKVNISWTINTNVLEEVEPLPLGTHQALEDCVGSWLITNTDRLGLSDLQWVVDEDGTTIPTKLVAIPTAALPTMSPITNRLINPGEPVGVLESFDISVWWRFPQTKKKRKSEGDASDGDEEEASDESPRTQEGSLGSQPFRDPQQPHAARLGSQEQGTVKRLALDQIGEAMQRVMRIEMIRRFRFVFDGHFMEYHDRVTPPKALLSALGNFAYTASQHRPGFLAMCGDVLGKLERSHDKALKQRVQAVSSLPTYKRPARRKRLKADESSQSQDSQQQSQRCVEEEEETALQAAMFERAEAYLNNVKAARGMQPETSRVKITNLLTESLATTGFLKWTESKRSCIAMECPEVDYSQGPECNASGALEESPNAVVNVAWDEGYIGQKPVELQCSDFNRGHDGTFDCEDDEDIDFEEEYEMEDSPDMPSTSQMGRHHALRFNVPLRSVPVSEFPDITALAIHDSPSARNNSVYRRPFEPLLNGNTEGVDDDASEDELERDILWDASDDEYDPESWVPLRDPPKTSHSSLTSAANEKHHNGTAAVGLQPHSASFTAHPSSSHHPHGTDRRDVQSAYDAGPCAVLSQAMDAEDARLSYSQAVAVGHFSHERTLDYALAAKAEALALDDDDDDGLDDSDLEAEMLVDSAYTAPHGMPAEELAFAGLSDIGAASDRSASCEAHRRNDYCSWGEMAENYPVHKPADYDNTDSDLDGLDDDLDDDLEGDFADDVRVPCDEIRHVDNLSLADDSFARPDERFQEELEDDLEGCLNYDPECHMPHDPEGWQYKTPAEQCSRSEGYASDGFEDEFDDSTPSSGYAPDHDADVDPDRVGMASWHDGHAHGLDSHYRYPNSQKRARDYRLDDGLHHDLEDGLHEGLEDGGLCGGDGLGDELDDLDDELAGSQWDVSAGSHDQGDKPYAHGAAEFHGHCRATHDKRWDSAGMTENDILEVLDSVGGSHPADGIIDPYSLAEYDSDRLDDEDELQGGNGTHYVEHNAVPGAPAPAQQSYLFDDDLGDDLEAPEVAPSGFPGVPYDGVTGPCLEYDEYDDNDSDGLDDDDGLEF